MARSIVYSRGNSPVHGMDHYSRVLLYSLLLAYEETDGDERAMEIEAQAAVWHDSRREDEYLDTGHGARAAVYYASYCAAHPDFAVHAEVPYLMRYHDLDDRLGNSAIRSRFGVDAPRVQLLYYIFKDADALDRWRLGPRGLDARYLRLDSSCSKLEMSRELVIATMDPVVRKAIEAAVEEHWLDANVSNGNAEKCKKTSKGVK